VGTTSVGFANFIPARLPMRSNQTYPPKKPKGLSLGLGYHIFLSIWVWVWVFYKSSANFELDNLKYKQKFLIFGYGFEHKF